MATSIVLTRNCGRRRLHGESKRLVAGTRSRQWKDRARIELFGSPVTKIRDSRDDIVCIANTEPQQLNMHRTSLPRSLPVFEGLEEFRLIDSERLRRRYQETVVLVFRIAVKRRHQENPPRHREHHLTFPRLSRGDLGSRA